MGKSLTWALVALLATFFMLTLSANAETKLPTISSARCAQPQTDNHDCPNLDLLLTQTDLGKQNKGAHISASADPAMRKLFLHVLKSFACMQIINYHAKQLSLDENVVTFETRLMNGGSEDSFSNKIHASVCGTVRYYYLPMGITCSATQDASDKVFIEKVERPYLDLVRLIHSQLIQVEYDLAVEGGSRAQHYLPEGKGYGKPSAFNASEYIQAFSDHVSESYRSVIANSGLSSADAKRFSSLLKCSVLMPEASGPDMIVFASYPSAFGDYKRFEHDLEEMLK